MPDDFLTVSTLVRAMFRMADGPRSPRFYSGAGPSTGVNLRDELLASNSRPDPVLRFLAELDRKLDAVLSLLQRETLQTDFPYEGHVLALSGAGMTLECGQKLTPGGYVEALLLLEEFPMRVISVLAEVREVFADKAVTGAPNNAYALIFTNVEEEDREHIIRFVFGEERKRIRRERDDA